MSFIVILFITGYCFEITLITFDMNFQDSPFLFLQFITILKIYPKVIWKWIYLGFSWKTYKPSLLYHIARAVEACLFKIDSREIEIYQYS